jgi:hypothetical protein
MPPPPEDVLPPDDVVVVQAPDGVTVTVSVLGTDSNTDDGEPQVVAALTEFVRFLSSAEVIVTVSPGFMTKENDAGSTAILMSNELLALKRYWLLSEGKTIVTSLETDTFDARTTAGSKTVVKITNAFAYLRQIIDFIGCDDCRSPIACSPVLVISENDGFVFELRSVKRVCHKVAIASQYEDI